MTTLDIKEYGNLVYQSHYTKIPKSLYSEDKVVEFSYYNPNTKLRINSNLIIDENKENSKPQYPYYQTQITHPDGTQTTKNLLSVDRNLYDFLSEQDSSLAPQYFRYGIGKQKGDMFEVSFSWNKKQYSWDFYKNKHVFVYPDKGYITVFEDSAINKYPIESYQLTSEGFFYVDLRNTIVNCVYYNEDMGCSDNVFYEYIRKAKLQDSTKRYKTIPPLDFCPTHIAYCPDFQDFPRAVYSISYTKEGIMESCYDQNNNDFCRCEFLKDSVEPVITSIHPHFYDGLDFNSIKRDLRYMCLDKYEYNQIGVFEFTREIYDIAPNKLNKLLEEMRSDKESLKL